MWEKKTERITIRLTETERHEIERRAESFGVPMDFIIRKYLVSGMRVQGSKRMILSANSGHGETA